MNLVLYRNALAGANTGGIRETQEMLAFCALNKIRPQIQKVSMTGSMERGRVCSTRRRATARGRHESLEEQSMAMERRKLLNKVAFVTGGASGIGRAAALAFARQGARLVVADVSEQGNQETLA